MHHYLASQLELQFTKSSYTEQLVNIAVGFDLKCLVLSRSPHFARYVQPRVFNLATAILLHLTPLPLQSLFHPLVRQRDSGPSCE
jgi:hypothetical protein